SGTFMLEIFIIVMGTVAVYELLDCLGLKKQFHISIPSYFLSIFVPLLARHIHDKNLLFKILFFMFFIFMFYLMVVAVSSKRNISLNDIAVAYMAIIYIIFSFTSIILLRDSNYGEYVFLLVFISAWMTDTGAFLIGIKFGRHKLIKEVSPKKTIEGAVGGIVVCILSFCVYGFIIGWIFEATPKYLPLIIVAFVMSIISVCGDLIASLIKRNYNIKDFGGVFPGHGGVLDRFDSIIATAPFLYILYSALPYFEIFF
ncbi:MAG: phosphatidate cytidylyltransferase, partial [Oscillospiraceae bacterium]|nr:phosphatidate cytidylyltransferase [Oscillospiraceae bacterium]